ncbi:MAG: hypothetical protein JXQ27_00900 [Acidobacteria bacterium]|nr:hypothetical protein [Acidobacteriota bacterium]
MAKKAMSLVMIVLLLFAVLLNSGCPLSETKGNVDTKEESDKTGPGRASVTIWSGLRQVETVEKTVNSVLFKAVFQDLHQMDKSAEGEYTSYAGALLLVIVLFMIFYDPLILQVPEDATNFSAGYTNYAQYTGSLDVQSGLHSIPVMPGLEITAEPGHQLVIIDFPADSGVPIPPAGDPEQWLHFSLDFDVNPARDIQVKCLCTGKVPIGDQTFYIPLCPVTTDFAAIPPITIPMADTPQDIHFPTVAELPPSQTVYYDYTSLMESRTMYFPRLQFTPDQGTEGYGFVNPKGENADVVFTAYDGAGDVLATSATYPWLAGQQNAYQADGILGLGSATDAWVEAESTVAGLLGFFLSQKYDSGIMAGMDGTGVFTRTFTEGVIPRVSSLGDYWTEVYLANPGDTATTVHVTGLSGSQSMDGGDIPLPAKGFVRTDLATLFPGKAEFDGGLWLDSPDGVIGTATIGHADDSLASSNAQPLYEAAETLYASHIVRYPGVYMTSVQLINTADTAATATLSPFYADGTAMAAPIDVNIPARGTVTLLDGALGLPDGVNSEGWLRVDSPGHPLMGSITFADPAANRYESTLALQPLGYKGFYYAQVANGQVGSVNYSTGLAVLNPSPDTPVDITIAVHLSDGSVNGDVVVRTLQPGEKYVRELSTLEGIGTLTDQASGYLHITASGPVFSFVLFYDAEANFMSAVQPQY